MKDSMGENVLVRSVENNVMKATFLIRKVEIVLEQLYAQLR